jgi:hypothetical protein
MDDLDFLVELLGDDADRVVGQRLRERGHLAHAHELLDDLGDGHAEVLGDVLHRRSGVDLDDVGARLRALVQRRDRVVVGTATATAAATRRTARWALRTAARATGAAGSAARGLRVDDDATPATGAGVAGRALAAQVAAVGTTCCAACACACAATRARAGTCSGACRAVAALGRAAALTRTGAARARATGAGAALGARAVSGGGLRGARRDARAPALGRLGLGVPVLGLRRLDRLAGDGPLGLVLVDRGSLSLHLDAGSTEALDDLLGGHVVLARQLVDSLLRHSLSDTSGQLFTGDDCAPVCAREGTRAQRLLQASRRADVGSAAGAPLPVVGDDPVAVEGEAVQRALLEAHAARDASALDGRDYPACAASSRSATLSVPIVASCWCSGSPQ